MIMQNITTWEERAIEQSSVERIAWPDLFHVAMRSLTSCTKVIEGLQIYPDHMIQDIIDTRGTWAAGPAKEFLRERLAPLLITTEETYRIVQLASFIAFQPTDSAKDIRKNPPKSLSEADELLGKKFVGVSFELLSIERIIQKAELRVIPELDATQEDVEKWNAALRALFGNLSEVETEWNNVFSIQDRLKDEACLFTNIFGIK